MDPVTTAATSLGTTDFSILTLFMRADFVVKSVIIMLIAASIFSWALIFDKLKFFEKFFDLRKFLRINSGRLSLLWIFINEPIKIRMIP